jgi:hypothetical protein
VPNFEEIKRLIIKRDELNRKSIPKSFDFEKF